MKRIILSMAVLLGVLVAPAAADTMNFTVDGIPVVLKNNPNTPVVAAKFFVKGGLPYYKPEQAGTEALLFSVALKGTEHYPKEVLQAFLARTGTQIGAEAGKDYTTVSLTCLRRDLDDAFKVFSDVIVSPTLADDEVALAKERQLNNIRQAKDDPDTYLRELADALYYSGHPYSVPPDGTLESVEKLDRDALMQYHDKEVTKARALVVIVGDVDRPTAEQLVRDGLGNLPEGSYTEPDAFAGWSHDDAETKLEDKKLPTNYIRGIYPAPALDDPDYIPMTVALSILRDRLFEEVRTKRNLTYAVSSGMAARRDNYGMLYVTAVEPDTTLRVMLHEVKKLQTEPIPDKELHDQLKVQITRYLMGQQTNSSQADALGMYQLVGGGWQNADKRVALMQKVTPADMQRVADKYIHDIDFVMLGDPQKWKDPMAADTPDDEGGTLH